MVEVINEIERRLLESLTISELAGKVHLSPLELQQGFKLMTGFTISEYIRYRRLYLAGLEAASQRVKRIDLACKYGYENAESFTKAFTRFHGVSPRQIYQNTRKIKPFLPVKISMKVNGGDVLDVTIKSMSEQCFVGWMYVTTKEHSYQEILDFWKDFQNQYGDVLNRKRLPSSALEQAVLDYRIGEYGISIDDLNQGDQFRYMIAGICRNEKVPEELTLFEIPASQWAEFHCRGQLPGAMQSVNTQIFQTWLPFHPDYQMAFPAVLEWYSDGDPKSSDYVSSVLLPIKPVQTS